MSKIIWLASYPKSGNTWFRIFLANYLSNGEPPIDINAIKVNLHAAGRPYFDEMTGVESADLTDEEIARLRPAVYRRLAAESKETPLFIKIHDALTDNGWGEPIVPLDATYGAIYFIRNVLDIAVSWAYHRPIPIEKSVVQISQPNYTVMKKRDMLCDQLVQKYLSWSHHVCSWVDASGLRVLVLRYEDMVQNPLDSFEQAIKFIGLPLDTERLNRALAFSSFAQLQQQELEHGFRERPTNAKSFFRRGQIGGWRDELTQSQVDFLLDKHGQVMQRFGYLSPAGKLLV